MAEKKSNTAETSQKSLKNTREKTAPKKANSTSHKTASVNRIQYTKKALLQALKESMGLITTACRKVEINPSTFYDYYNNDPEFKAEVEAINEYAIDEGSE